MKKVLGKKNSTGRLIRNFLKILSVMLMNDLGNSMTVFNYNIKTQIFVRCCETNADFHQILRKHHLHNKDLW